jgi:hypothetical protein
VFEFEFTAPVIKWQGKAAWHFIVLPEDMSREIDVLCSALKGGWGSLKVDARIGTTRWNTSIFPSKEQGAFLLPINAKVRKAQQLSAGDEASVTIRI